MPDDVHAARTRVATVLTAAAERLAGLVQPLVDALGEPCWPGSECDAPEPRPVYVLDVVDGVAVLGCRCLVCARCRRHTGNTTQGHFWRFCARTGELAVDWHFCCPGDCAQASPGPPVLADAGSGCDW